MSRMALSIMLGALLPATLAARTFTVTNTSDDEEVVGSFRWAVERTEFWGSADTILFAIPRHDPGFDPAVGAWTIQSGSAGDHFYYDFEDDSTLVDGFSQARFIGEDTNPLGPEIELHGIRSMGTGIKVEGDDITIRGLCINGFNPFVKLMERWSTHEATYRATVTGCYLGTDPTGSFRVPPRVSMGLTVNHRYQTRIGGDAPEERNIIAGAQDLISIGEVGSFGIVNNHIGVDRTGAVDLMPDSSSFRGISIYPLWPTAEVSEIRDNVIAGRQMMFDMELVGVRGDSSPLVIHHNLIGEGVDGTPLGADFAGITVELASTDIQIRENVIAHVRIWHGVQLAYDDTDRITISRNAIYGVGQLGIDLSTWDCNAWGVNYIDGEYGPGVNEEIDTCVCDSIITTADGPGGTTTAYFTAMRECTVEVFIGESDGFRPQCPVPGGHAISGMQYLGDAEEVSQGPVFSTYRFVASPALAEGIELTATATNANGSTSEFGCSGRVPGVGASSSGCRPDESRLMPPRPNPCLGEATVCFHLPQRAEVCLDAYDAGGRRVAGIVRGVYDSGIHGLRWDLKGDCGRPLPAGSYLLRLTAGDWSGTQPLVIKR